MSDLKPNDPCSCTSADLCDCDGVELARCPCYRHILTHPATSWVTAVMQHSAKHEGLPESILAVRVWESAVQVDARGGSDLAVLAAWANSLDCPSATVHRLLLCRGSYQLHLHVRGELPDTGDEVTVVGIVSGREIAELERHACLSEGERIPVETLSAALQGSAA